MVTPEGVLAVYGAGFGVTLATYLIALQVGMVISTIRKA